MLLRRFMQHFHEQNWFAVWLDVIVVIVGILIAFQVEEYREHLNDREREIALLEFFIEDLNTRKSTTGFYLETRTNSNNAIKEFVKETQTVDVVPTALLNQHRDTITHEWMWKPSRAMIMGLLESTNMELIEDEVLRNELIYYYLVFESYYWDIVQTTRKQLFETNELVSSFYLQVPAESFLTDGKRKSIGKREVFSKTELDEVVNSFMKVARRNDHMLNTIKNFDDIDELILKVTNYKNDLL